MSIKVIGAQVVGGEQVPNAVQAMEGRSSPAATDVATTSLTGPLAARVWLEVQRAELVDADDLVRVTATPFALAVRQRIQVEHPLLFAS